MGTLLAKVTNIWGCQHRVHVLYLCVGPCNLSTKCQKSLVQYSNLLSCYVDTIFVHHDLGTNQGMSTKLGDQKFSEILHK